MPEAANFYRKSDCLGCAVLLCLIVCLTLLASFFSSFSSLIKNMHNTQVQYILVIFADLYFHKINGYINRSKFHETAVLS